jgi:hypothetical protein
MAEMSVVMECNHSLHWDKISLRCKENYTINNYSEVDITVGEMAVYQQIQL